MPCVECGVEINRDDPARYDVFGDGRGPYCAECFASTTTGGEAE